MIKVEILTQSHAQLSEESTSIVSLLQWTREELSEVFPLLTAQLSSPSSSAGTTSFRALKFAAVKFIYIFRDGGGAAVQKKLDG